MPLTDIAFNPVAPLPLHFVGWGPGEEFPHEIYTFLIKSIREADRDAGDLLVRRWLDGPQFEFESIYTRIQELLLIYDPEQTPAAALSYVKWLVGFTGRLDALTGGLGEDDLRTLISIGVRMWKMKGTDAGINVALGAFSKYHVRILHWFFFRTLVDETDLGRYWLLDLAGLSPSVQPDTVGYDGVGQLVLGLTTLLGATEAVPHDVRVRHVAGKVTFVGRSSWDGSVNRVVIGDPDFIAIATPTPIVADFRVGVDPDEYVSDVRVVCDGSLNRDLVEKLLGILRPVSERFNLLFVSFQDLFVDHFWWTSIAGDYLYVPSEGYLALEDAVTDVSLVTDFQNDLTWAEGMSAVQFRLRDADPGAWFEFRFYHTSAVNFYAARVDPLTRTVSIESVTAGIRTVISSAVVPAFHLDVLYLLLVSTEDTGVGHQIKYFLDGNHLGTVVDPDHVAGRFGLATAAGQRAEVIYCTMVPTPLDTRRVGP